MSSTFWISQGDLVAIPTTSRSFPTYGGEVPSKENACSTIEEAAMGLGIPILHPKRATTSGGGHSLRVSGAQSLSRAGFDSWTIGLPARWGSSAALGYIRDAPLGSLTLLSRRAILQWGSTPPAVLTATPRSAH